MTADGTPPHPPQTAPKRSALHALHVRYGASLAETSGWLMPMRYSAGSVAEHIAVRSGAALFDLSHLPQFAVRARSGRLSDAARALERLTPADVVGLAPGRMRHAAFTTKHGTIRGDLTIAHAGDHFVLVCNAGGLGAGLVEVAQGRPAPQRGEVRGGEKLEPWEPGSAPEMERLSALCVIERISGIRIALQGPQAEVAIARLAPAAAWLSAMGVATLEVDGARCLVSRSGLTGEDGFELSLPGDFAADVTGRLIDGSCVTLAGLAARESLRLEAGIGCAGVDFDATTTLVEARLARTIGLARRRGGARAGGFPGAERILSELENPMLATTLRVGLREVETRTPAPILAAMVPPGAALFEPVNGDGPIGHITCCVYGPSVEAVIALGYLPARLAQPGTRVVCEIHGSRVLFEVSTLPFVPWRTKPRAPFLTPAQCAEHAFCEC